MNPFFLIFWQVSKVPALSFNSALCFPHWYCIFLKKAHLNGKQTPVREQARGHTRIYIFNFSKCRHFLQIQIYVSAF